MDFKSYVPYDKKYPLIFEKEKERLKKGLGEVQIEHFGSTAVPNLGGKGYIDIFMAVPKDEMRSYSKKVQEMGYEFSTQGDLDKERLFHKRKVVSKNRITTTFNLHITYIGSENFALCIAFKEYLKVHPEDVQRYSEAKKTAVLIANKENEKKQAGQAYMDSKSNIIKEIIEKIRSNKVH